MKTAKRKHTFLNTICLGVCLLFSFILPGSFASGKTPADTTAIINFYNPAGSFLFQPDASISVNEREMRAGLLYDLENKKIVWQKEMSMPYPIASLTKMMVALITVEDIHAGKVNWTDNVHWTREIRMGRGKKKRTVTENVNYSLLDIFKAAMIASNNEAAEQMARYVGGDVQSFVDRMNTRAREINMNSTYYGNPTGLPASGKLFDNSASPTDLLILTLEMLKYDEILQVTGMGYADINNGRSTSVIRNHNHLTIDYKGEVDGMKTGYTKRAGFCLAATSNKCDHRLISIVLGSRSPNLRNEVVKDMINDYYSSIGLDKLGPYCEAPSSVKSVSSITHVVKHGETLASVAYKYNCSETDIKSWNKLRKGRIAPGQKLTIASSANEQVAVVKSSEEDTEGSEQLASSEENQSIDATEETVDVPKAVTTVSKAKAKSTVKSDKSTSKYIIYVVQPGDTLFSIAKRYDLANINQLKAVNKISKGHVLKAGAKIKVPVNS